jgi:hypothetical protein
MLEWPSTLTCFTYRTRNSNKPVDGFVFVNQHMAGERTQPKGMFSVIQDILVSSLKQLFLEIYVQNLTK